MARGLALVAVAALVARCSDAVAGAQRALARSLSLARALSLTQHGPSPALGGFDGFGARATVPKGEHSPFTTQCPIPSPLSRPIVRIFGFDFRKLPAGTTFVANKVLAAPGTPVVAQLRGAHERRPNGVHLAGAGFVEVTSATLQAVGGAMTVEFVGKWSALAVDQYIFDCSVNPGEDNIRISTDSVDAAKLNFKVRAALRPVLAAPPPSLRPPPRARDARQLTPPHHARVFAFRCFTLPAAARFRCGGVSAASTARSRSWKAWSMWRTASACTLLRR